MNAEGAADEQPLALTTGFGHHYRPVSARVIAAFRDGLIVLDTNVLLNVFRYTPSARKELLGVLEGIADRCFVPHQVAHNRNRVKVVADRQTELQQISEEMTAIKKSVRTVINGFKNRSILRASDVPALEEAVADFLAALERAHDDAFDQYDLEPDRLVGQLDKWTARLDEIFAGRVGPRPSESVLASDVKESERRHRESLAPGFKDQTHGDYLWWAEVLRHTALPGKPLLVVSDDSAKGDWVHEERGLPVGPQPILIEDVISAGGKDLVLLTTRDLLQLVGQIDPQRGVSGDTIDESNKVLAARDPDWTQAAYERLLAELTDGGYDDRVEAITAAALSGGFVGRDEIYRILGSDEDSRSLRHFATPVHRLRKRLVRDGLLAPGAAEALMAVYDGPGKTIGYQVPPEFSTFILEWEQHPDDSSDDKD